MGQECSVRFRREKNQPADLSECFHLRKLHDGDSGYSVAGQLTSQNWSYSGWSGGLQYTFSAAQNNGQISYEYDALKRLTSASSTGSGTQTFQYDGFGNLTGKTLGGVTTAIPVNGNTNRLTSATCDANGNMTSGAGSTLGYDGANRLSWAMPASGGTERYAYAPNNQRIYRKLASGPHPEEWTLYGAYGERLAAFYNQGTVSSGDVSGCGNCGYTSTMQMVVKKTSIWFGGKLIWEDGTVYSDRLGTNRAIGARFRPYGEESGIATADDRVKFATYTRDGFTGLDYADQRYYASGYGRFNSPDVARGSARKKDSQSWNRYPYVSGDPVNRLDPKGLCYILANGTWELDDDDYWHSPFAYNYAGHYEGGCNGSGINQTPAFRDDGNPFAGSGGGGYDQTSPPGSQYKQADAASEAASLGAAYNNALSLLANPKCTGLFNVGGAGLAPDALLKQLRDNADDYGAIRWGQPASPSTIAEAQRGIGPPPSGNAIAIITLNDNVNGGWFANSVLQNAQTLLHELGHAYDFIYGSDSTLITGPDGDGSDPVQKARQGANKSLISILCH